MQTRVLRITLDTTLTGPALEAALASAGEAFSRQLLALTDVRGIQLALELPGDGSTPIGAPAPSSSSSSSADE